MRLSIQEAGTVKKTIALAAIPELAAPRTHMNMCQGNRVILQLVESCEYLVYKCTNEIQSERKQQLGTYPY